MKLNELRRIQKLYFGYEELARALGINQASARVAASRYVKQGLLVRVKRNVYVRRDVWESAGREQRFSLANLGQVPSYVSLMTALDYHEVTTQLQREIIESVALKRTREIRVDGTLFRYTKISGSLYSGFHKEKGFFIAIPEKAFLDAMYLMSLGRYALDLSAIDRARLDLERLEALSARFPSRTRKALAGHGYLSAA
jgi:predicted transcriptional regulator of viral defense system